MLPVQNTMDAMDVTMTAESIILQSPMGRRDPESKKQRLFALPKSYSRTFSDNMPFPKQHLVPRKQPLQDVNLVKEDMKLMKAVEQSIQEAIMGSFPDGVSHVILNHWHRIHHLDAIQIIQAAESLGYAVSIARIMQLYPEITIIQRRAVQALVGLEFRVEGGLSGYSYYAYLRSVVMKAKKHHDDPILQGLSHLFLYQSPNMVYNLEWQTSKTSDELKSDVGGLVAVLQAGYFPNQAMFALGTIALEPGSGRILRQAGVLNVAARFLFLSKDKNPTATMAAMLVLMRCDSDNDDLIDDLTACILLDMRQEHDMVEIAFGILPSLMGIIVDIVYVLSALNEGEE